MVSATKLISILSSVIAVIAINELDCTSGRCFETFLEPRTGVRYGIQSPALPNSTYANEFIGQIDVPASLGRRWHGISLSGFYLFSPLIAAWPNPTFTDIVSTVREAKNWLQPTPYSGVTLTTIETAFIGQAWRWTFRCQGCLTWDGVGPGPPGGGASLIDAINGVEILGWGYGPYPTTPLNPAGWLEEDHAMGGLPFNVTFAQSSAYHL